MPADPDKTVTVTMGSDGQVKVEATHTEQYADPPSFVITITKRANAARKDEAKDLSLFKDFVVANLPPPTEREIVGKVTKTKRKAEVLTAQLHLPGPPKSVPAPVTYDVTVNCSGGIFTDTITVPANGGATKELALTNPSV